MRKIRSVLQKIRLFMILPWVNWNDAKFIKDLNRWKKICHLDGSEVAVLAQLLWEKKEFRNLFIYRNSQRLFYRYWIALWYRPMDTLFIETSEIGGGLFIQHGFSTMIAARSIGENCWINQQVTIGYTSKGCPVIGDDVMITCGAKVLGDITVNNGTVIGANAVVVKDVEPGAVMGGVPAKDIRKKED